MTLHYYQNYIFPISFASQAIDEKSLAIRYSDLLQLNQIYATHTTQLEQKLQLKRLKLTQLIGAYH